MHALAVMGRSRGTITMRSIRVRNNAYQKTMCPDFMPVQCLTWKEGTESTHGIDDEKNTMPTRRHHSQQGLSVYDYKEITFQEALHAFFFNSFMDPSHSLTCFGLYY